MAAVPYSLPILIAVAAAAEVADAAAELAAVAEPPVADETAALAEELAPLPELPPLLRNSAVAFLEPQTTDWQNVWPARSLGWEAVHCARHSSHFSESSVCA